MLDESASEADAQFERTFGDSKHVRDKSNPKRVGEGFCARIKLAAGHCTRIRLLVKLVLRSEWAAAARLRDELTDDGVQVATIVEDDDLRELTVKNLRECGSSTPVNMLSADEIHLLEPLCPRCSELTASRSTAAS